MKIGHICLTASVDARTRFESVVEALDRLAVEQHVITSSAPLARRLQCCPYVTVGPAVRTPVMAYCLMPAVDLVHIHDEKSGQAGLLLTLTRSTPFVMSSDPSPDSGWNPLRRSVFNRAQALVPASLAAEPDELVALYRRTIDTWSKLPQDADCG